VKQPGDRRKALNQALKVVEEKATITLKGAQTFTNRPLLCVLSIPT
jgi:2'-5' RNA ligase